MCVFELCLYECCHCFLDNLSIKINEPRFWYDDVHLKQVFLQMQMRLISSVIKAAMTII